MPDLNPSPADSRAAGSKNAEAEATSDRVSRENCAPRGSVLITSGSRLQACDLARPAVWLSLVCLTSRAAIFLFLTGRGSDIETYKSYSEQLLAGQVPFREFAPEYPPLVFVYTGIPAIIDPSLKSYFQIFRLLTCAVDCGIWVMVLRINLKSGSEKGTVPPGTEKGTVPIFSQGIEKGDSPRAGTSGTWQCLLYILGTTALGPLIYDRIDLVLGAMLLVAVMALLRGRENLFKLAIGAAIAFKLIPVVLVPMILAREWRRGAAPSPRPSPVKGEGETGRAWAEAHTTKWRRMVWTCALLALPTVLSFGAVMALGGWRIDKLFAFHAERPIQIESGPAAIEMVLMMFGVPAHVTSSYGSFNLETSFGSWLIAGGALLLAAVCVGSAVMVLRRRIGWHGQETVPQPEKTEPQQGFLLLMVAVLTAALVLSKVLSPQYFLFLLPLLVLLPVPRDKAPAIANWLLIAAIYILTGLIFPWWYFDDLVALRPAAEFMLILRNELLVVLAVSLAWRAWTWTAFPRVADSDAGSVGHE